MVNNKRPSSIRKQRASLIYVRRSHEAFKRFAAGDGTIMRNGSEVVKGLVTERKMTTPFAAIVNASCHDKARRS
jgi:hypothetical protein